MSVTASGISPQKGSLSGNNLITISGSGFSGITTPVVNFGAAGSTNVTVVSDTVMTAVNPNSATPGPVTVSVVDNSGNDITAGTFDYKAPEVISVNPSSSTVAGGEKITITGKYLTGTAAVNFGVLGVPAKDIIVLSDETVTVKNPASPSAQTVNVEAIVVGQTSAPETSNQFKYVAAPNNGVPMIFSAEDPSNTYIQFLGDANPIEGSYYSEGNLKQLEQNKGYSLQDLTGTKPVVTGAPTNVPAVLVKSFSGRVYISFGNAIPNLAAGYTPDANNQTAPFTRYQYFEPTIKDSQMNVDLSYIDFTSISMSLTAENAPHGTNVVQKSATSLVLATATGNSAKTKDISVIPAAADQLPSSSFIRVISPQLGNAGLYHDFSDYLKSLSGQSVKISGTYVGTGDQPSGKPTTQAQNYDYTGTFDANGGVTLAPNTGSGNGSAPGVPTVQQGPGVGIAGGNIVLSFDDLNAQTGVYGCNAPYTLGTNPKTAGITNDVYGQIVGDLFSGLNFGYIGSTELFQGRKIGSLSSTEWWGGKDADGSVVQSDATPGGNDIYFDTAQKTNASYYNSYAGSISKLTTGYGFPLQDRLGKNLMTCNTAIDETAYLKVWIDKQVS